MSNRRLTANVLPDKVASGEMTLDEYITTMQRKKTLIDRLIAKSFDWDDSDREDLRETPLPLVEDLVSREQGISVSESGEDVPTSNVESAEPDDFTTGSIDLTGGPPTDTSTEDAGELDADDFSAGVIE